MAKTVEEAKADILVALPYMRDAVELAAKEGKPMVGILATQPDGSGRIVVRFEAAEFFEDLALILGAGELTKEQRQDARAKELLDMLGPVVSTDVEN